MASGVTKIVDVIVPEIFAPYVQVMTEEKSRLIRSGAVQVSERLNSNLAGGGITFNEPFFKDLENDADNVSTDNNGSSSSPNKIGTAQEIQVRLSRNNSWSSMDLTAALAGTDPMNAIANRVAEYWVRREQAIFIATMTGIFNDNEAAPSGSEHTQNDLTNDVSNGGTFIDGVTNFSAEAFLDAAVTMGDSMGDLTLVMMHSLVYNRALKNNLIDFVSDSVNGNAISIPRFLGREVIVDDGVPRSGGVFETWLFGAGAVQRGSGSPKVPVEVDRAPAAGDGGGQEILYNRKELIYHPVGHKFAVASPASGGPSNASTSGNLAHASSWERVFPERKQIKIARLITTEF